MTSKEMKVIKTLEKALQYFLDIGEHYDDDLFQFKMAIYKAESVLSLSIVRREYSFAWDNDDQTKENEVVYAIGPRGAIDEGYDYGPCPDVNELLGQQGVKGDAIYELSSDGGIKTVYRWVNNGWGKVK